MRALLFATLLAACGGPSRSQIAETPTAQTPRTPSLAPPASGADKDRYQLDQSFQDMQDTQQAQRETGSGTKQLPPGTAPRKKPPPK